MLYAEISEQIIKSFYHVYNTLGYGFSSASMIMPGEIRSERPA
jgi:hypothetical protein